MRSWQLKRPDPTTSNTINIIVNYTYLNAALYPLGTEKQRIPNLHCISHLLSGHEIYGKWEKATRTREREKVDNHFSIEDGMFIDIAAAAVVVVGKSAVPLV